MNKYVDFMKSKHCFKLTLAILKFQFNFNYAYISIVTGKLAPNVINYNLLLLHKNNLDIMKYKVKNCILECECTTLVCIMYFLMTKLFYKDIQIYNEMGLQKLLL